MGTSSADTPLAMDVKVQGTVDDMGYQELPEWYRHPTGKPSVKDFEKIYGQEILPYELEKTGKLYTSEYVQ